MNAVLPRALRHLIHAYLTPFVERWEETWNAKWPRFVAFSSPLDLHFQACGPDLVWRSHIFGGRDRLGECLLQVRAHLRPKTDEHAALQIAASPT